LYPEASELRRYEMVKLLEWSGGGIFHISYLSKIPPEMVIKSKNPIFDK
jgi:hypothetical protein